MTDFIPGLELNARFYTEVVGPLVSRWPHSAARLGFGSEVLNFDTERSTDHGWGPQLVIFVKADLLEAVKQAVDDGLPDTFLGWPVRYGWDNQPVRHHVEVTTTKNWMRGQLGLDPTEDLRVVDWLLIPQQKLLEVTSGAVYRDDDGVLSEVRQGLAWYPEQVWLWILAAQWQRISQAEAFVGRTAEVGDDLGTRLVTAGLASDLMRLWFLLHRTYWPYSKWFGSAFSRLPDSEGLSTSLADALDAQSYKEREAGLATAYRLVADCHDAAGITDRVGSGTRSFHNRPYEVLMADRFTEACLSRVSDPSLTNLPLIGSVDQVSDSTELLSFSERARGFKSLYMEALSGGERSVSG